MPSMDKLSTYMTQWHVEGENGSVIYRGTEIVRWTPTTITLRNGGWDTVTTRRKMNQASNQFGLGFGVYRDKGKTVVSLPGGRKVEIEGQNNVITR